jgi:hypothetical protein
LDSIAKARSVQENCGRLEIRGMVQKNELDKSLNTARQTWISPAVYEFGRDNCFVHYTETG